MMAVPWTVYAPTRRKNQWVLPDEVTWETVEKSVKRLQMRIAQAAKLGKHRKVKSLQWILAHSYHAKLLAVRRVTSNKGKNTPGVDGVVWKTSRQKTSAVTCLNRRGYRAQPLRRVYIPKRSGKLRPLGIPTMRDRAMQALYALTLAPVAETHGDPNSYGFRPMRCCADAMVQCFIGLSRANCSHWVLEADIKSCFDRVNHDILMSRIARKVKDKRVLRLIRRYLQAGIMVDGLETTRTEGTPQGSPLSPLLSNIVLDDLDKELGRRGHRFVRYADDCNIYVKSRRAGERATVRSTAGNQATSRSR